MTGCERRRDRAVETRDRHVDPPDRPVDQRVHAVPARREGDRRIRDRERQRSAGLAAIDRVRVDPVEAAVRPDPIDADIPHDRPVRGPRRGRRSIGRRVEDRRALRRGRCRRRRNRVADRAGRADQSTETTSTLNDRTGNGTRDVRPRHGVGRAASPRRHGRRRRPAVATAGDAAATRSRSRPAFGSSAALPRLQHGQRQAGTIAMTTMTSGSVRRRGRPSGTGSNSTLTRAAVYPASGTIRPSASMRGLAAQPLELGAGHLVAGVVARAHERRRLDVLEAERQRLDLHLGELVGVVVALERQVLQRRAQVLADREDVDVDRAQRLERLGQLGPRLAEADHQARLRVDGVADLVGHLLGPAQDVQRCGPSGPACGPASGAASPSRGCG